MDRIYQIEMFEDKIKNMWWKYDDCIKIFIDMERRIFQLEKENYDLKVELGKIPSLFYYERKETDESKRD